MKTTAKKNKTNGNEIEHVNRIANVMPEPDADVGMVLPQFDFQVIRLRVEGTSRLVTHAWSEKAKKMMRDKQGGKATTGRENKDPEKEMEGAMYRTADGKPGIPAISFKNAAVTACTSLGKAITKVAARQAFHVLGDILPIEGEYYCREDMVRVGMGTADLRYRPCWEKWAVQIDVRFNARAMSAEQIVNLFNVAGFAVGVCEYRPECNGDWGCFKVA